MAGGAGATPSLILFTSWAIGVMIVSAGLGLLMFPMALLSVCLKESVAALNLVSMLKSIRLVGWSYLTVSLAVLCLMAIIVGIDIGSAKFLPIFGPVIAQPLVLYLAIIAARWIGLIYRAGEEKLNWLA